MSPSRTRCRPGDERGLMLVVYTFALVALVTVVALVLDLGQLRFGRRDDKKRADTAAAAGIGRLPTGCTGTVDDVTCPWSGVCAARDYLVGNAVSFDGSSERWTIPATPAVTLASSPCANRAAAPFTTRCLANDPTSWARLTGTAQAGRVTIEIRSGYVLPDPAFPEDAALTGDNSVDSGKGSCDHVAVIITRRQAHIFGGVVGGGDRVTTVRSVGRLDKVANEDFIPSLLLLERRKCDVLTVSGSNTRVIAQPFKTYPGVIQIDSADDSGSCPSPILNSQATSGGPAAVACSADSTTPGCKTTANGSVGATVGSGTRPGRIGIYALNATHPASEITSAFSSTYGDTPAVRSSRSGRRPVDDKYRASIIALDAAAKAVLTGNPSGGNVNPPGCPSTILLNTCTGNGKTWLVLRQVDCGTLGVFFLVPGRTSSQNVWFDCDLTVNTPLRLTAANSSVVVTKTLTVSNTFTIDDPRTIYVGGTASGNKIGLQVTGSTLRVGVGTGTDCGGNQGLGHTTALVVGNGSFKMSSSATTFLCQTTVFMANGFGKLSKPYPCTDCSGLLGNLDIGSGSRTVWSAPNEIRGRKVTPEELAGPNRLEDLAFWTEAGGATSSNSNLNGGADTQLTGVFFLGNSDAFALTGNGSLPINLSAQFIATALKVSGGALLNLVPDPDDSVSVISFKVLLVR